MDNDRQVRNTRNGLLSLAFHSDTKDPLFGGVSVSGLTSELCKFLDQVEQPESFLGMIFRVLVLDPATREESALAVSGMFQLSAGGFYFCPHFPFQAGVPYRAQFEPSALEACGPCLFASVDFSLPLVTPSVPSVVARVFPSDKRLPENLLRMYVEFSLPMRRGFAAGSISILDESGRVAEEVLYRPPLELWDQDMRTLTVLLDPGRLKRGVGPNRMLGPPLKRGDTYILRIDGSMEDAWGRPLLHSCDKIFKVTEAVRAPVLVEEWKLRTPAANTFVPCVIDFPTCLDHALLENSLLPTNKAGEAIPGSIEISKNERRWSFTPKTQWQAGNYVVRISSYLEDVCGNSLTGSFDRTLGNQDWVTVNSHTTLPFQVV